MTILIGIILIFFGGHFWFKKQEYHFRLLKQYKGLFNNYSSYSEIFYSINSRLLKKHYFTLIEIALPFYFPFINMYIEDYQKRIILRKILIYSFLASFLFAFGYYIISINIK